MTDESNEKTATAKRASGLWTILISAGILALTVAVVAIIFNTEPEAQRTGATRKTAMLVEVAEAKRGDYHPMIEVLGTVEAPRDVQLQPRVSGEVIRLSPDFDPGGVVREGDLLLEIDPADYDIALRQRKSELHQMEAALAVEEGRQIVAREDIKLLENEIPEEQRRLILREPQLESAQADVESAEALVARARLDLERTQVRAPFDAEVLERAVDVGSQVSPSQVLGRLVGRDRYWVVATVPVGKLPWLAFETAGSGEGNKAILHNRRAWPAGETREGRVTRLIGSLESSTRLARVLVTVEDPLGLQGEDKPRLIIGSLVEVRITGEELEDVVRINRDYLRENDTVWLMVDGKLEIREVEILFRDPDFAYVSEGLADGDLVVTTSLATVAEGVGLRTETDAETDSNEGATSQ